MGSDSPDERLEEDLRQLHDCMWNPRWKGDAGELRKSLIEDAKGLDGHLRAGGRLLKNVEALDKDWGDEGAGESLFELLFHTYHVASAAGCLRSGDFKGAAKHAGEAAESISIGVCANAGCFEFVEEWEGRKIDFEAYAAKLAGALRAKGIQQAANFGRQLNSATGFALGWDWTASREEQELAARAALASATWCALASVSIRGALGTAPKYPYEDLAAILGNIVSIH